jgi:hypothetical protein
MKISQADGSYTNLLTTWDAIQSNNIDMIINKFLGFDTCIWFAGMVAKCHKGEEHNNFWCNLFFYFSIQPSVRDSPSQVPEPIVPYSEYVPVILVHHIFFAVLLCSMA